MAPAGAQVQEHCLEADLEDGARRREVSATLLHRPARSPCTFVAELHGRFGSFVPMGAMTHGIGEGFMFPLSTLALQAYYKDVLGFDGVTAVRFNIFRVAPWTIKPLMGMASDAYPLFGFHRTSYVVIACLLGLASWTGLGLLPASSIALVPLLFFGSFSACVPDVMVDAVAVELSKGSPGAASEIQSFLAAASAVGALVACAVAGPVVRHGGPRAALLLCNVAPLCVLIPGVLRFIPEQYVPTKQRRLNFGWLRKHASLGWLGVIITLCTVGLSLLQVLVESPLWRCLLAVTFAGVVLAEVYRVLSDLRPVLAKAAAFMLLRGCLSPSFGSTMYQWQTSAREGPHFSPIVVGLTESTGAVGLLLGAVLFQRFLTSVSYQRIIAFITLAGSLSSIVSYVFVRRWNVGWVPDVIVAIGQDAYQNCMARLLMMPIAVLATKVCPAGLEATIFALLGALRAFAYLVGALLGNAILEALGVVHGEYENLADAQLWQGAVALTPLLLVPFLVPNLTPLDPILEEDRRDASAKSEGKAPSSLVDTALPSIPEEEASSPASSRPTSEATSSSTPSAPEEEENANEDMTACKVARGGNSHAGLP